MLCFWVVTQGSFIYFEKIIDNEQLVFTRLALSLSGIIAIYFSAIENKLMPEVRSIIYEGNSNLLISTRRSYFRNGIIISTLSTLFVFIFYLLFVKNDQYQLSILLIMCLYQSISGVFKFSSFQLKAKKLHKSVFFCNLISVIIIVIIYCVIGKGNGFLLPLILFLNGVFSSVMYHCSLYINRGK
jgi:hypothetical protein